MENITFTILRIETFLFILEFFSNQKLERRKENTDDFPNYLYLIYSNDSFRRLAINGVWRNR